MTVGIGCLCKQARLPGVFPNGHIPVRTGARVLGNDRAGNPERLHYRQVAVLVVAEADGRDAIPEGGDDAGVLIIDVLGQALQGIGVFRKPPGGRVIGVGFRGSRRIRLQDGALHQVVLHGGDVPAGVRHGDGVASGGVAPGLGGGDTRLVRGGDDKAVRQARFSRDIGGGRETFRTRTVGAPYSVHSVVTLPKTSVETTLLSSVELN